MTRRLQTGVGTVPSPRVDDVMARGDGRLMEGKYVEVVKHAGLVQPQAAQLKMPM